MIAYFKVKNFYSIREEQCLSFEPSSDSFMKDEYTVQVNDSTRLLKIAMLYGNNASGKTNILTALEQFRNIMLSAPDSKSDAVGGQPFLLDNESRELPTEMTLCFFIEQKKYELRISYLKNIILFESLDYYMTQKSSNLYTRTYIPETDETTVSFGGKLELKKKSKDNLVGNTTNNCSLLAAFDKTNVETSLLNQVYNYLVYSPGPALPPNFPLSRFTHSVIEEQGKGKEFLINLLKASDFNISDINVKDVEIEIDNSSKSLIEQLPGFEDAKNQMQQKGSITEKELVFTHESELGQFSLDEDDESRGTIRFLGLGVLLDSLLNRNCTLCIDELETSLHYELLAYFIKLFLVNSNYHSQLIFTTHDTNLLNEDFIRRDTVWFTDKDSIGATHLERLSSLGLHKTISPYNAYRQGKLVELPFLGSLYLDLSKDEEE